MSRDWLVVGTLFAMAGCGRSPTPGAGSECAVMARRCSREVVQLCLPDASTRTFRWVSALDCAEYDDVCEEEPESSWADCATELPEDDEVVLEEE